MLLDKATFLAGIARACPALLVSTILYFTYNALHVLCRSDPDAKSTLPFTPPPVSLLDDRLPKGHPYIAPRLCDSSECPGHCDSRSPCPALNTLANHGYLPRNGRKITGHILEKALMDGFNLSKPIATSLAWGAVVALGQVGTFSLHDLARHNCIEHDASITHPNICKTDEYAPIHSHPVLMASFLRNARRDSNVFGVEEFSRARIRREAEPGAKIDGIQQLVARGEIALVLQIFGNENFEVPYETLKYWWWEQRLPDGWIPSRQSTAVRTVQLAMELTETMNRLRGDVQELDRAKRDAEADRQAMMDYDRITGDAEVPPLLTDNSDSGSDDEQEVFTPPTIHAKPPPQEKSVIY